MKTKTIMIGIMIALFLTSGAYAQMGGGHMGGGMGPGTGGGYMGGRGVGPGAGHMGGGTGYGMAGAGGMMQGMMGNTMFYGYLDVLSPIKTPDEARAAIQAFIDISNSNLQISELWGYGTIFKAELSDTNGVKAFDLIADKFTGAVMPEMGMSMMLNASYGRSMYRTSGFGKNLAITPDQAADLVLAFVTENELGYTLETPETYPGYYKFHTKLGEGFGMDIMVNGYNGGIWMNTLYGLPTAKY